MRNHLPDHETAPFVGPDRDYALQTLHGRLVERAGPVATFPWHAQQEHVLRASTDTVVALGGNQSGKTQVGIGAVSRLVRREGPIYDRLEAPEKRPLVIWIAPKTLEKYQSLWEPRILDTVFQGMKEGTDYTYRQNPYPVWTWYEWRATRKGAQPQRVIGGTLHGKAQKQGFMAFESDAVDLIVFDEEPEDPRILTSAKARFATTNGVLMLCFTPLLGMSFTYHQFYAPCVKPSKQIAPRCWQLGTTLTVVEMGMADNPAARRGGGVDRLQNDPALSQAEKNARLYGHYGYTEGLLFPMWVMLGLADPDPYILDALPPGRLLTWTLTVDPNKRHGGLLTALDADGNRYFAAEHYAENVADSKHADSYRNQLLAPFELKPHDVDIWGDPGGAGAQAMLNLAEFGLFAKPVRKDPGSVAASIKRLRGAAYLDPDHRHPLTGAFGAPRTYFLRWNPQTQQGLRSTWTINGIAYAESRLMWELRQYRQETDSAPDTPVKVLDDVVDCARYFELARQLEPKALFQDPVVAQRARLDPVSRHEAEAFEKIATEAETRYRREQATAGQRFRADRHAWSGQ